MTDSEQPTVETLFDSLDRWRHFAGYPLEPRVDALFGLFLPKIIEECCGVEEMDPNVIPQFPLKKIENNQSDKVDFFAVSKDGLRPFLIELKTDMGSKTAEQNEYLIRAQKRRIAGILCDFKNVAAASKYRRKYFHLISALSDLRLLKLPPELEEKICEQKTRGSTRLIGEIEVIPSADTTVEVVFIQPRTSDTADQKEFSHIHFDKVAASIEGCGELGCLFANYLRRWEKDAGE